MRTAPIFFKRIPIGLLEYVVATMLLAVSMVIAENTTPSISSDFERGKMFFSQRDKVDSQGQYFMIDSAINYFTAAVKQSNSNDSAGAYLLHSYYFKGTFIVVQDEFRKYIYQRGIAIGEHLLRSNQKTAALFYWQAALWGKWAEVYGTFAAAREGVAGKMKELLESSLRCDSLWDKGSAYMVLGRVHHMAPYIPLLLSWPSKSKAEGFLQKAHNLDPQRKIGALYLAEFKIDNKDKITAKELLRTITNTPAFSVEDRSCKKDAIKVLSSLD